jgi:serine/threonine protein kinase
MKMQIKQGLFTFPSPYWDDISKEAKDLITKLLKVDPVERFTATEALDHPWMRINVSKVTSVTIVFDVLTNCFIYFLGRSCA